MEYRNESKFTAQFIKKFGNKFPLIVEGFHKRMADNAFLIELKSMNKFEEKPAKGLTSSEKELLQIYAE